MPALSESELRSMMKIPCQIFVETGTFLGETTDLAKNMFEMVHTIEIQSELFERARNLFAGNSNVKCYLGDSSIVLEDICKNLKNPTCFWLDGHYSGGKTGKGEKNVPLYAELEMIMKYCSEKCVILIDDCRLFQKTYHDGIRHIGWEEINTNTILEIVKSRINSYSFFSSNLDSEDRMAIVLN